MNHPVPPELPAVLVVTRGVAVVHPPVDPADAMPDAGTGGGRGTDRADAGADGPGTDWTRGALRRVTRGGYVASGPDDEAEWQRRRRETLARCRALAARTGDATVVSHVSAALLHGLWTPPDEKVHVTHAHHGRGRADAADVARHTRPLDLDVDTELIAGIRVTRLRRTVLDCITTLPPDWALAVADSALRRTVRPGRALSAGQAEQSVRIRAEWAAGLAAMGRARGVVTAREIVRMATPLSESPGESRTRCLLVAAGFPEPVPQRRVATAHGVFYPDLTLTDPPPAAESLGGALPAAGTRRAAPATVFVEFDGAVKYGGGEAGGRALVAEKIREDALRRTGAAVVRVTSGDLAEPACGRVVAEVLGHLPALRAAGLRPVPSLSPRRTGRPAAR